METETFSGEKTGFPYPCYIKFRIEDQERFRLLSEIFENLKDEKHKLFKTMEDTSDMEDEKIVDMLVEQEKRKREEIAEKLFVLFDDQALNHFWWPTKQEMEEYVKHWSTLPVSQRLSNSEPKHPWSFSSMIDSLLTGEYDFVSCTFITSNMGKLVFLPHNLPYGSSDAIKVLIEAFGCHVIGAELGTGYTSYS